jgi:hypothetical protein
MIDFAFLHYALRETLPPVLSFLKLIKSHLKGDTRDLVIASDYLDDVSTHLKQWLQLSD